MKTIVGVMGPGESAGRAEIETAAELGRLVAVEGWVLLTGGRNSGVMAAATRGAHEVEGSLTVGVLPYASTEPAPGVDLEIVTDLGSGRNNVNVLTSRVVFVCGMSAGTLSEVALAIQAGRPVVLLESDPEWLPLVQRLGGTGVHAARSAAEAVAIARQILDKEKGRP